MLGKSTDTTDPIERFVDASGTYLGNGENHDGESFVGELTIEPAVDGAGVFLHFEARDDGPRPLHEDHMMVGMTRDGQLYLWGLDSSTERIRKHELREATGEAGNETFRFGIGRRDNQSVFREEIAFEFAGDRVSLDYAWAKPGEPFGPKSAIELVPDSQFSLSERTESADIEYREFQQRPSSEVLAELGSVYTQVFGSDRPAQFDEDAIWSSDGRAHLGIARADDKIVGFKLGYERRPGRFYSWLGAVLPAFRRRGIATELLARQHTWAREAGYETIRTKTTNQWREMLLLNLREGFDVVGTEHGSHGDIKIVLKKPL